jgi:hypothetical protein
MLAMSAQVEEMTASAQELLATAAQLKALVARFRVGDASGRALPSRPGLRLVAQRAPGVRNSLTLSYSAGR